MDLLKFANNRLNKFYNPKLYKAPPERELSEENSPKRIKSLSAWVELLHPELPQEYQERSKIRAVALISDMGITAQEKMTGQAVKTLMKSAKKQHVMVVMSLALNVKLAAFDKAKQNMDKMLAKLEIQQQNEIAELEMCKKNIDETEDSINVENNNKADLAETNQVLTNTLATPDNHQCCKIMGPQFLHWKATTQLTHCPTTSLHSQRLVGPVALLHWFA